MLCNLQSYLTMSLHHYDNKIQILQKFAKVNFNSYSRRICWTCVYCYSNYTKLCEGVAVRAPNWFILTDIIVFSAGTKLKAQGKGSKELELLWKLQWTIWRQRPVALPPFETLGSVVTGAVAIIVDHVENVAFSTLIWDWADVVWTVNIKVVVDADINVVITSVKAARDDKKRQENTSQ